MSKSRKIGYIVLIAAVVIAAWVVGYLFVLPMAELRRAEGIVQNDEARLLEIVEQMYLIGATDAYADAKNDVQIGNVKRQGMEFDGIYYSFNTEQRCGEDEAALLCNKMKQMYRKYGINQIHIMDGYAAFSLAYPPMLVPRIIYFPGQLIYSKSDEKALTENTRLNSLVKLETNWY
ncbi:MAG: hypothetical protein RRY08_07715, partial [Christensenella sp.]